MKSTGKHQNFAKILIEQKVSKSLNEFAAFSVIQALEHMCNF